MSPLTRRELLLSLPALAVASTLLAQEAPLRVGGLHYVTLAVSDVGRSLTFYQSLFGMPVQARHGSNVLLRVGDGPLFIELMPAGRASTTGAYPWRTTSSGASWKSWRRTASRGRSAGRA